MDQKFDQNQRSASLSGRLVYTEPITEHFFFEANYQYGWSKNVSNKSTYNGIGSLLTEDGAIKQNGYDYDNPDEVYSNRILNRSITQRAGINFSYQKEKFRAQLGVAANPTDTYNETTGHEAYRNKVVNWSPQAMLNYEFSDNAHVRFFYFGRSAQPSTSQLLPVPDN